MDYITDELKGTVTEEAYGQPAGRITVDQGLAFTDVAATSPYYDGIEWAVDEGITNGTTATTFSPYQNCTRAQIITYLWRAAGSPEPASTEPAYTDVKDTSLYFFKAAQWASEQGLVEGETFDPYAAAPAPWRCTSCGLPPTAPRLLPLPSPTWPLTRTTPPR